MKNLYKKISIVLMLFAVFIMTAPAQLAFANQKNKMIDESYFDNPETFNQDSTAVKESAAVGLTAWDYIKMLLALIFVLLLLIWVLKFINKKSYHFQQNQIVRNIGGISVGSQKSVQILQIGDKLYIVGVGENVELIKEISNRDEIDKLLNLYNEKQMLTTSPPFIAELFKKLKGQSKTRENSNHSDFGNMLNQRLSEIQKMRRDELEKWKEKEHDK